MSAAETAAAVSIAEAEALFDDLRSASALLLAVSGGPDSTALMMLAARWRAALAHGPDLIAVTVDHGLRPQSAREARAVKQLAGRLGVRHRTLRWTGSKPATGLQDAARVVRYRLLAAAARAVGARHILTGHTLDDQAETVLLRMARGSGITGLGAMARVSLLPCAPPDIGREGRHVGGRGAHSNGATPTHSASGKHEALLLVRPLIDLPKTRLIATLAAIGLSFVDDQSNQYPRFTRARLRTLMPALAAEGLDAQRLAMLARRLRRAEAAIELGVDAAVSAVSAGEWTDAGSIAIDAEKFFRLPAEVALRLLGRAIAQTGDEGPVELGKLETLFAALLDAGLPEGVPRMRRTLAGALVMLSRDGLRIARAPPRSPRHRSSPLTTRGGGTRTPSNRL